MMLTNHRSLYITACMDFTLLQSFLTDNRILCNIKTNILCKAALKQHLGLLWKVLYTADLGSEKWYTGDPGKTKQIPLFAPLTMAES